MEKQLPKNWVETTLGKISNIVTGNTPSKNNDEFYGNYIPWVKPGDINIANVLYSSEESLSAAGLKKARLVPKGSIMVTCIGNLGNVAMAGVDMTTNQQINSIVLDHNLLYDKYLLFYSITLKKWLIENSTSTTISMVNKSNFEKAPILLPPLAEQERIAEKLDALFGQLDSVRGAMSRIPTLLANLRQQILTHAVTGKLTQEWRQGKEQYDLYDVISNIKSVRIKSNAKSQANKEKIKSIYSDDSSSIDFFIPDEWISVNLDKVCMAFSYGTSAKSEEYGKYPVLRMGNIQKGKITWDDLKYTSDDNEFNKYKVNKGDILFNRTNSPELVGKTAIFDTDNDACYAGYIIKITPCIEVNSSYLNIVLNSQYARRWCWENKSDGVSQSNINAQKISKFTIPYPHLSEQKEIVNRVQSLFEKLDLIEQRYQMLKTKLENLPQAILHKAFKGELVEQLPSDGNATDLLREIEQLRKSLKKK